VSDDFLDPRLAERLARAARAAQTLSETLWETLQEELGNPRSERVTELSEQLGALAATVASLARVEDREREAPTAPVQPEPRAARTTDEKPPARESSGSPPWEPPSREQPLREQPLREQPSQEPPSQEPRSRAVLVDELARERPASPEIEIRDARGEDGPTAWIDSIGRRLERYRRDGSPFAVLLVEIVDVERLRHAERAGEVARLTSLLEDVLARGLRPADSLTCESPGRYWLLAPQTDEPGCWRSGSRAR
jgi:hypothetical protein